MSKEMRKYIDKFKERMLNENKVYTKTVDKKSWDSIMEALNFIENLDKFDDDGVPSEFGSFVSNIKSDQGQYCEIRLRWDYNTKVADGWGKTKKIAIYNCIMDFFKEYEEGNF